MIELRTSERATFKRCPQRWEWGVKEQLSPHRESTPLWFGTAVHIALSEWYQLGLKRGPHPALTFLKVLEGDRSIRISTQWEKSEEDFMKARDLGQEMLTNYVEHWGKDPDKFYICTEQTGSIYLPKLHEKTGKGIKYYFTFDGVYRDEKTGYIWLDEHKTAASIDPFSLPLNQQASSYWAVAEGMLKRRGLIDKSDHIQGIMFNFLRKAPKDKRPRNADGLATNKPIRQDFVAAFEEAGLPPQIFMRAKVARLHEIAHEEHIQVLGAVSAVQTSELFERHPVFRSPGERRTQLVNVRKDAWHIDRARNDPEYPITKNPTKDCKWDCDFYRMCQLHEEGDMESVEDYKEAMYTIRDPYEAYRKSA